MPLNDSLRRCAGLVCCILVPGGLCLCAEDAGGKFTIYMGGKAVASETYTVERSDGKIQLSGNGKAQIGPLQVTIDKFTVVTDDQFHPVSAAADATLGQMRMQDTITFADGKANNQVDVGQGPQTKEDDVHADALVVNSNLPLFAWSFLMLRADLNAKEPQTFNAYIVGQAEVPVTVSSKGKETVEFADRKAELTHLTATFEAGASGKPVTLDFWVNDARKIIKAAVPAQNVEAYQAGFERKGAAAGGAVETK